MKKIILISLAAMFLLLLTPLQAHATLGSDPKSDTLTNPPEIQLMINRLEEIKAIDVSLLARSERRGLRREVRDIDKELKAYDGGGLYISVGAVILIVLLLILLL